MGFPSRDRTCCSMFNANFLLSPKSRDVGLVTIAQWTDTIVDFVDAFRLCPLFTCECWTSVGSSVGASVCAREQVLEIEFCVASAFVVVVAGVVCSASRVACLLLVHFSSLSSGFSEKVQGILWISSCVFSGFVCLLAAGHAARGVPSSIQAEKRELRLRLRSCSGIGIWDWAQIGGGVRLCLSSLPGGFYAFAVIK